MGGKDPAAAWQGIGQHLATSGQREMFELDVLRIWAGGDSVSAAAALDKRAGETQHFPLLGPAFGVVGAGLARTGIARATKWANSQPAGPVQSSAVGSAVATWFERDPAAAADWLNGLPPGPGRDAGALALVQAAGPGQPQTAVNWPVSLSDPAMRTMLVSQTASRWLIAEPEKADAWMPASADLTEEEKETILRISRLARPLAAGSR